MRTVYLDYSATTPLDSRVLQAMMPFLTEHFGNASSVHGPGRQARFAVEESREKVAALIGAEPGEIIFTSGGTEANNTALRGVAARKGILTSAAEHESVLRPAEALAKEGRTVTILTPGPTGAVLPEDLESSLDNVGLVSLMHANNEIGTMTDVPAVVEICHRRDVLVHCDAVQTAGYGLIRVDRVDVDLLTISGHKFYGPKGIGVLYVRGGVDLAPLVLGGSQERRRRGGTENVAAVVGFAEALSIAMATAAERRGQAEALRKRLYDGLRDALGDVFISNTPLETARVAPHILSISFPPAGKVPIDGEMLLLGLDMEGVRVSAGSACTSGALEPSHVLQAIGRDRKTAMATIRFSVGKDTTAEDVDYSVAAVSHVFSRLRHQSVVG